jgi:hypothetical protein
MAVTASGGGGSRWAEEEWTETSVVYYPTATRGAATPSKVTFFIVSGYFPFSASPVHKFFFEPKLCTKV